MNAEPRTEIRRRIISRLSNDEWMNKHFGIVCHAHDVADAVMEVLDDLARQTPAECGCPVELRPIRVEHHTDECSERQATEALAAVISREMPWEDA